MIEDKKELAIQSINAAAEELRQALEHLEMLPTFDPSAVLLSAHTLNNYMSVISGTVDLLKKRLMGRIDQEVFVLIENLGHSNELMRQTVSRLTHTSVASDVSFLQKRVDFFNLVELAVEYYRHEAEKKQIAIHIEKSASFRYAWTDTVATAAILDNLLSNAVKYSEKGKNVWVSVTDKENYFICAVRDEGPGINQADQERLFNRGVKLGHTPTNGEPSTGYGLAVAKELVQKLGGCIRCESEKGVGSTFFFHIPVSKDESKKPDCSSHPQVNRKTS